MTKSKSYNFYVILILLLLGSFVLFSAWSAHQASTRGSQISDPAYYSKGLKYNHTQIEIQAAASRGWQLETTIEKKILNFRLFDSQQQPIAGANGVLTLYPGEQQAVLHLRTTEIQPGRYQVKLLGTNKNSVQARIEFELQGILLSRQLLLNP
jgi:nitrogen fixation protein FixH